MCASKEPSNLAIHPIKKALHSIKRALYSLGSTGWRRLIGCLEMQVIFRKKANNYRALLRKMTYEDKTPYASTPPCINRALYFYQKSLCSVKRALYSVKRAVRPIKRALQSIQKNLYFINRVLYLTKRACVISEEPCTVKRAVYPTNRNYPSTGPCTPSKEP